MTRLMVGVVALALALAGCGGDPKADPSPTPSPPVTSPVSTTPSAPVLPEAAKADTKAGAIAFVRYYIELINHAQATGDVGALAAVEDAGCQSCSSARNAVKAIYDAGGAIQGGSLSFQLGSALPSPRVHGWLVTGSLRFAAQVVVRKAGGKAETLGGGAAPVNAFVSADNAAHEWRVMDWTRGA